MQCVINYVINTLIKVILYYSGLTSNEDKLDITNILDKWSNADVVIYSPTIEAGVSFDRVSF